MFREIPEYSRFSRFVATLINYRIPFALTAAAAAAGHVRTDKCVRIFLASFVRFSVHVDGDLFNRRQIAANTQTQSTAILLTPTIKTTICNNNNNIYLH